MSSNSELQTDRLVGVVDPGTLTDDAFSGMEAALRLIFGIPADTVMSEAMSIVAGGDVTMTGDLTLAGEPTADLHAATKAYTADAANPSLVISVSCNDTLTMGGAPGYDLVSGPSIVIPKTIIDNFETFFSAFKVAIHCGNLIWVGSGDPIDLSQYGLTFSFSPNPTFYVAGSWYVFGPGSFVTLTFPEDSTGSSLIATAEGGDLGDFNFYDGDAIKIDFYIGSNAGFANPVSMDIWGITLEFY